MFNCTLDSGEWCSLLCCRGPQRRRMSLCSCSKGAPWRRHFLGSIRKMNSNFRYRPPNISLVSPWYSCVLGFFIVISLTSLRPQSKGVVWPRDGEWRGEEGDLSLWLEGLLQALVDLWHGLGRPAQERSPACHSCFLLVHGRPGGPAHP